MVYVPCQRGEISNLPPLSSLCLPNPYLLWVLEGHIQHWGWAGTGVGTALLVEVMCIGVGSPTSYRDSQSENLLHLTQTDQ